MELLADKFDQVSFVGSYQARSAPLSAAASWCLPCSSSFLGCRAADQFHRLAGTADRVCSAEPPHCREAAQQAFETSFALLEGTQEIVLITPHSDLQGEKALTSALNPDFLIHFLVPAEREALRTYAKPDLQACLRLQLA